MTLIEKIWFPFWEDDPLKWNPYPDRLILSPNCVPIGIFNYLFYPYIVEIVFLHPRIASIAEIYISLFTLLPYLIKSRCFFTLNFINKSPLKLPLPLNFIVSPSLTPFGIMIYYLTLLFWRPLPLQLGQNSLILEPYPPQELQIVCITNIPCLIDCIPEPLQVLHLAGLVPGLHLLPLQV